MPPGTGAWIWAGAAAQSEGKRGVLGLRGPRLRWRDRAVWAQTGRAGGAQRLWARGRGGVWERRRRRGSGRVSHGGRSRRLGRRRASVGGGTAGQTRTAESPGGA